MQVALAVFSAFSHIKARRVFISCLVSLSKNALADVYSTGREGFRGHNTSQGC